MEKKRNNQAQLTEIVPRRHLKLTETSKSEHH